MLTTMQLLIFVPCTMRQISLDYPLPARNVASDGTSMIPECSSSSQCCCHARHGMHDCRNELTELYIMQQMEVLAFTTMVISALAAIIHFASVNIIHNEGTGAVPGGHICNPGDVACEQNYNFVIVM